MSGIEAIRCIRTLEAENPDTMNKSLIIALTGLAGSDDKEEAYGAGVDLFLTKPVSFKTVDKQLDAWKAKARDASNAPWRPPNSIKKVRGV